MQRIDLSYFYRLSLTFEALKRLEPEDDISVVWFDLMAAQSAVQETFEPGPLRGRFRSSHASGAALFKVLHDLTERDWGKPFTAWDKANVVQALTPFDTILQSELAVADAYYVVEKRGYSTVKLVTEGELLFPPDLPMKVPEAVGDLREAARCLAFELATASGFHTLRAVEAVLRRYWTAVTGNATKPKQRNIGVYLAGMKKLDCGDPKVLAALQQLKDLHRNVLFHPEDTLDTNGAISLLGIAHSVVAAMLLELPVVVILSALDPQDDDMAGLPASEATEEAPQGLLSDVAKAFGGEG